MSWVRHESRLVRGGRRCGVGWFLGAGLVGCGVDERVVSVAESAMGGAVADTPVQEADAAAGSVQENPPAVDPSDTRLDPTDPPPELTPPNDLLPGGVPDPMPADVTPPDTFLVEAPPRLTNSAQLTFAFTSTEPGTFECQMDSALAVSCSSPFTTSVAEGTHVLEVTAIDAAGNRDATPAVFTVSVDLTPPETELRGVPAPASGRFAAFAFSSVDDAASFECSLDSSSVYQACTSPQAYVIADAGSHTFRVRATDSASNRDPTPASSTFTATPTLATPFPDSPSTFCSDGASAIACPLANAVAAGQDGNYLLNRPSYTATADTVSDSVSGLTWERGSAPASDWDTQVSRCAGLTAGGLTDWRLPSRLEFLTVLDAGRGFPAFDPSVFSDAPSDYYWIGQELDGVPSSAWHHAGGTANLSWNGKDALYSAKCVRGASASGAFSAAANGLTVNDSRTGLVWQTGWSGTAFTWTDALGYCNDLALASNSDWRLPTVKELQTLVDVGTGLNPSGISPAFPPETAVEMWSSSPDPRAPVSSYSVDLLYGLSNSTPTGTPFPVRCVR